MVAYKYDRLKYDCDQIWLRPNNVQSNNVRQNIDIGMENLYIQAKQGSSAREIGRFAPISPRVNNEPKIVTTSFK